MGEWSSSTLSVLCFQYVLTGSKSREQTSNVKNVTPELLGLYNRPKLRWYNKSALSVVLQSPPCCVTHALFFRSCRRLRFRAEQRTHPHQNYNPQNKGSSPQGRLIACGCSSDSSTHPRWGGVDPRSTVESFDARLALTFFCCIFKVNTLKPSPTKRLHPRRAGCARPRYTVLFAQYRYILCTLLRIVA